MPIMRERNGVVMRSKLKSIGCDDRHLFTAEVVRFGKKNGWTGPVDTILVKNVRHGDETVCDHLWFTCGKRFKDLNLKEGDHISFNARVSSYIKGYRGFREDVYDHPVSKDWRLSFPSSIRKVKQ